MLEEDVYELGRDNTKPLSMERSPGEYVAMWARQASAWQTTCLTPPSKLGGGALLTPLPETFSVFSSMELTESSL